MIMNAHWGSRGSCVEIHIASIDHWRIIPRSPWASRIIYKVTCMETATAGRLVWLLDSMLVPIKRIRSCKKFGVRLERVCFSSLPLSCDIGVTLCHLWHTFAVKLDCFGLFLTACLCHSRMTMGRVLYFWVTFLCLCDVGFECWAFCIMYNYRSMP